MQNTCGGGRLIFRGCLLSVFHGTQNLLDDLKLNFDLTNPIVTMIILKCNKFWIFFSSTYNRRKYSFFFLNFYDKCTWFWVRDPGKKNFYKMLLYYWKVCKVVHKIRPILFMYFRLWPAGLGWNWRYSDARKRCGRYFWAVFLIISPESIRSYA